MRKLRELCDGADYHVTARINRGEMVFESDIVKELFLDVTRRAKKKYKFEMKNFCIMNNHIHFLIKPGKNVSLSRIMQWILSVFARAWNKMFHLKGHVWGERFFSRIIAGVLDFLKVFMYIDLNPVEAHLVNRAEEWKYGGIWHHKKRLPGIVEKPEPIVSAFCPDHLPE